MQIYILFALANELSMLIKSFNIQSSLGIHWELVQKHPKDTKIYVPVPSAREHGICI